MAVARAVAGVVTVSEVRAVARAVAREKIFILSPKTNPSSHKDLVPIPVRGWIFCVWSYALTYLPEHYM